MDNYPKDIWTNGFVDMNIIGLDDSAPAQTSYYLLNKMVTLHPKQADMVISKKRVQGEGSEHHRGVLPLKN